MTAVRAGILTLVVFAVAAFGGVQTWEQAMLELGAGGLLVLWGVLGVRQQRVQLQWNWLYLPLVALGLFTVLQLVFGRSAYPYATKIELLLADSFLTLFFLCVQSFESVEELGVVAWFVAGLGFLVSLFGIVQHFAFNGRLYWFVRLESGGGPFGPFINRNHFAGFVELTVSMGLALLLCGACPRDKVMLLGLFSILPVGALVLAGSRGGIISFLFELAALVYLTRDRHRKRSLLLQLGLLVVAASLVVWLGGAGVVERFQELKASELPQDQRFSMDKDTWQIFLHHPWIGTGLGTLATVYPQYESRFNRPTVDHAHNDYLELLADTGLLGGLCGLSFVGLLLWQGLANWQRAEGRMQRAVSAGSLAGCFGLLIHSLVDFNFHVPSNASLFVLLSAMATTKTHTVEGGAHIAGPSIELAEGLRRLVRRRRK